ncbi:MAG TPA: serine esterase [Verrucomicrobiae bacterium]|jgi:phospholipase/carboxylesterase|nr:serine esterase [Verrucomicrobiae bacterium]
MLEGAFIPAADKASKRLMIMLHGLGDSIEGYRWLPETMNLPWLNFLLVNAPDAYYGGYSWFDYPDNMGPGILRSRKLLFELLDGLQIKGFAPRDVTLGGFSQGGLMTMDAGLRYPHRLAGLVDISGWVFEIEKLLKELSPVAREQRLLISHGPYDPLIPFAPVKEQAHTLKKAGLSVDWHEFPKGHTIYGEEELSVLREFVCAGYA